MERGEKRPRSSTDDKIELDVEKELDNTQETQSQCQSVDRQSHNFIDQPAGNTNVDITTDAPAGRSTYPKRKCRKIGEKQPRSSTDDTIESDVEEELDDTLESQNQCQSVDQQSKSSLDQPEGLTNADTPADVPGRSTYPVRKCRKIVLEPAPTLLALKTQENVQTYKNSTTPKRRNSLTIYEDEHLDGVVPGTVISRTRVAWLDTPRDLFNHFPADDNSFPPAGARLPEEFYDFKWSAFPEVPVEPETRREPFTPAPAGPAAPLIDPYDIFVAIWDRTLMTRIVDETNRCGRAKASNRDAVYYKQAAGVIMLRDEWEDTNVDELYLYLGLLLAMSVVVKQRLKEYWEITGDIFQTPGFGTYMSFSRFVMLNRFFAFDVTVLKNHVETVEALKPLWTHLSARFSELHSPGQDLSLDSSLTQWKAFLDMQHFNPYSPSEMGYRSFVLSEAQSGYVWRFEIHAMASMESCSTPTIVLRLLEGLEGRGHTLWMDSFYNSPCLARRLKQLGVDCAGTLRTNRQFVPKALDKLAKNCLEFSQLCGLTAGDVDIMVYKLRNRIGLISTYHGNSITPDKGHLVKRTPRVMTDYLSVLSRLDRMDRILVKYPLEEPENHRVRRMFKRMLNVSVWNAHVIFLRSARLDHRSFRMALINSLIAKHYRPPPKPTKVKRK